MKKKTPFVEQPLADERTASLSSRNLLGASSSSPSFSSSWQRWKHRPLSIHYIHTALLSLWYADNEALTSASTSFNNDEGGGGFNPPFRSPHLPIGWNEANQKVLDDIRRWLGRWLVPQSISSRFTALHQGDKKRISKPPKPWKRQISLSVKALDSPFLLLLSSSSLSLFLVPCPSFSPFCVPCIRQNCQIRTNEGSRASHCLFARRVFLQI